MGRPVSSGRYRRRAGWPDGVQIRPVAYYYKGILNSDPCARCGCPARVHLVGYRRGRPVHWECQQCLRECDFVPPEPVPASHGHPHPAT